MDNHQIWDSRARGILAALLAARAQPPICPQPRRVMGTCSSHACQPLNLPQALQMLEPVILAAVPAPTQTSWSGRQPSRNSQKLQSSRLPTQALHPLTPHPAGPQQAARPGPAQTVRPSGRRTCGVLRGVAPPAQPQGARAGPGQQGAAPARGWQRAPLRSGSGGTVGLGRPHPGGPGGLRGPGRRGGLGGRPGAAWGRCGSGGCREAAGRLGGVRHPRGGAWSPAP